MENSIFDELKAGKSPEKHVKKLLLKGFLIKFVLHLFKWIVRISIETAVIYLIIRHLNGK